nr:piggyBac transposable element-derived protein 2-like [Onthophagus taurus]
MNRKPLKYEELVKLIEEGLSDIECLSGEEDECEIDLCEQRDAGGDISDNEELEVNAHEPTDLAEHSETLEDNETVPVAKKGKIGKKMQKNIYYENNELTPPTKICWRKNVTYITPEINWYTPPIPADIDLESPLYFFRQYFTKDLFELMTVNTNLFAVQQHARFAATTQNELEVFVGMHILMGNLPYPRLKCYWENKLRIPTIADAMPRDRFHKLRSFLHFVNVEEKPPECKDRFWKIRPLYNTIRKRILQLPLETKLSIDEQMVPFKGRLNVKQCMKNKPSSWGVKIYTLCGASGVVYDFIIYQGTTTEFNSDQVEIFGVGASAVLKLSERIQ